MESSGIPLSPPPDIAAWVENAPGGAQRELREAVHTILTAIAGEVELRSRMIMKGGILLAVQYHSPRFTKDIDFSTSQSLKEVNVEQLQKHLEAALSLTVESLPYDLDCRIQSCRVNPPNRPEASFPSIELKIGHARKGTPKHKRLLLRQCPSVISLDFSLNEQISGTEQVLMQIGKSVRTYSYPDLVAEKFRALLQQVPRDRYRRQDVYDLFRLSQLPVTPEGKRVILETLFLKSRAREIEPRPDSLDDPEVRRRAAADYHTLADEVEDKVPDFDFAYSEILRFYHSLPWQKTR